MVGLPFVSYGQHKSSIGIGYLSSFFERDRVNHSYSTKPGIEMVYQRAVGNGQIIQASVMAMYETYQVGYDPADRNRIRALPSYITILPMVGYGKSYELGRFRYSALGLLGGRFVSIDQVVFRGSFDSNNPDFSYMPLQKDFKFVPTIGVRGHLTFDISGRLQIFSNASFLYDLTDYPEFELKTASNSGSFDYKGDLSHSALYITFGLSIGLGKSAKEDE